MTQLILSGLAVGFIYALVSFGFVMIYRASGAINFAFGEVVMIATFLVITFNNFLHFSLVSSFLIAIVGMILFGYLFQRFSYFPVRDKPLISVILASIGMSIMLRNSAHVIWGAEPYKMEYILGAKVLNIYGNFVSVHHIFIIIVSIIIFVFQNLFFSKTSLGRKLEAVAQDKETAVLMGVNVNRMIILTFCLGSIIATIAGLLVGPIFFVSPEIGLYIILKVFIVVVIGGFGSIPGVLIGGIGLGLSEVFIGTFISSVYKDALSFLILITFLLFKPQGIFGEKIAVKL